MNKIFSFEPVFFKKLLLTLTISLLPIIVFIFYEVGSQSYMITYAAISILILFMLIFIFYLGRYDLSTLSINNESIAFEYFNKSFFKKKSFNANQADINVTMTDDILYIHYNNEMVALIRKNAAGKTEWEDIRTYFQA